MIISDKFKYVFLATPRTGSTAIISELCKHYSGRSILEKHTNYHEFLRIANKKQKDYFVFAGIRNPLDDAVSMYEKLRTNHGESYTNPSEWIENGGWVTQRMRNAYHFVQKPTTGFLEFIKYYYRMPYTSRINLNGKHCDYIIRFENLQEGFSNALQEIGLERVQDIPRVNPTKEKKRYPEYYEDKETILHSAKVFAPFMIEWGYDFPSSRFYDYMSSINFSMYEITKQVRELYSRMSSLGLLRLIDAIPV